MRLIDADELLKHIPPEEMCSRFAVENAPTIKPDLTHIIFETLAECGIYGEEATIKLIGTLKRLGRNDLLPPCVR